MSKLEIFKLISSHLSSIQKDIKPATCQAKNFISKMLNRVSQLT